MDMRTTALGNGWTGVVADRPAGKGLGTSGFAAQLSQAAEAAKAAEVSGNAQLKAAYGRLSAMAKRTLGSLKAGGKISEEQWYALRKEMWEQGLINSDEFFCSDPHIVIVGYTDENGEAVSYFPAVTKLPPGMEGADFLLGGIGTCEIGGKKYGRVWVLEKWGGDPFQFLDRWLEALRGWRDDLDQSVRPDGGKYDTSHLTCQMEAREKVNGMVKHLMDLA